MVDSVVSDSDGREDEKRSQRETKKNSKKKEEESESEGDAQEEEDEEEYEIEAIIGHKKGVYEVGKLAYHVKWKGYDDPKDNTWVSQEDASNAKELIDEYWRTKNVPRKSQNGSAAPKKSRKSAAQDSPEPPASTKKRGRKTIDEEEKPTASKRTKRKDSEPPKSTEPEEDVDMEDGTPILDEKYMKNTYKNMDSWETLVAAIDTVERYPSDATKLTVYAKLTQNHGGHRIKLSSTLSNSKFPQKMLKFYEGNLKWRESEVPYD